MAVSSVSIYRKMWYQVVHTNLMLVETVIAKEVAKLLL